MRVMLMERLSSICAHTRVTLMFWRRYWLKSNLQGSRSLMNSTRACWPKITINALMPKMDILKLRWVRPGKKYSQKCRNRSLSFTKTMCIHYWLLYTSLSLRLSAILIETVSTWRVLIDIRDAITRWSICSRHLETSICTSTIMSLTTTAK